MQHLAIIPDGNRRWAAQRKLESFFGHKKGTTAVRSAIKVCLEQGIKYLSFYTFSLENFRRSALEKEYLFNLLATEFTTRLPELIEQGIRVRFIGDASYFPDNIRGVITQLEEKTRGFTNLNLNLLFCYGAQQEMVNAVKTIAQKVKAGLLAEEDINEGTISNALWTQGIPDPELIIRTSGISRLSNFLLFQAAYSEFLFLDCFWPEITEEKLLECITRFKSMQRNFGH